MANYCKVVCCLALFILLVQGSSLIKREERFGDNSHGMENNTAGDSKACCLPDVVCAFSSVICSYRRILSRKRGRLTEADGRISISIETDNYSEWILKEPHVFLKSGKISTPPRIVFRGKREAMVAHKTPTAATGTFGTVSWLVGNSGKRIIVMWSVPYDHDWYSNWLAVGIIDAKLDGSKMAGKMYYNSPGKYFSRAQYYYNVRTIQFCDATMCVAGSMGTSHSPLAHISFFPKDANHLAPTLRSRMNG